MNVAGNEEPRSSASPRQAQAYFFRTILAFLAEEGLTDAVQAKVSSATRVVMEHPPFIGRWLPSLPVDEIEEALQELGGAALNVRLGRFTAARMVQRPLRPVLMWIFAMFGRSPEALFRRLNLCFSVATRGISFVYLAGEPNAVVARFKGSGTPEGAFHVLRGALLHAFEVLRVEGEVGPPEQVAESGQGATVKYVVRWS